MSLIQPRVASTASAVTPSTIVPAAASSAPADEASLVHILWRRRRVVALGVAAAVVAAAGYLALAPTTYTAVSRIFIEPAGGKMVGLDTNERAAFLYTQREVITSTPVLADALAGPGVLDFETFAKDRDAITGLRNKLSVDVGKKDDLISVALQSRYPNEAAQLVAAVVAAYSKFQVTQRGVLAGDILKTFQAEKDAVDKEVADRAAALQAFALKHRVVGSESAAAQDDDSLKAVSAALTQAHMDALNATARLASVRAPNETANRPASVPDVGYTAEDEAAVRGQLSAAEAVLDALYTKYDPASPIVQSAKRRVEQLKRQRYAVLQSVKASAVQRETDLRAFYDAEQQRLIEQRAYSAEYARMNDDLKRLQERADAIDTKLRDLKVNDVGKMANVSVLEPARIDPLSTGPSKGRTLALALVGGLVLGLAGALAWDQIDGRLSSAQQAERWLGLTALGTLPTFARGRSHADALYAHSEPNSPFARACSGVWSAIQSGGGRLPPRTLAVTSALREDGRSTVACGLAIAMAQTGRRVLLIDADVATPGLARLLGVEAGPGLKELLEAGVDPSYQYARGTVVPNLSLLPGGRVAGLNAADFSTVLEAASREFEVVIVDTPAARRNPAARLIAAHCQATVLVVRLGQTDGFAAARVRNDFYNAGATVLGVIANRADGAATPTVTVMDPQSAVAGPREPFGLPAERVVMKPEPRPVGGLSVAS